MVNLHSDQLHIQVDDANPAVIALEGELDPHTAPLLARELDRLRVQGVDDVVLDLSRLRFIDSSGLRVVIGAHRDLLDRGGRLTLRSPSPTAQRLLEITGLVDHIDIVGPTGS